MRLPWDHFAPRQSRGRAGGDGASAAWRRILQHPAGRYAFAAGLAALAVLVRALLPLQGDVALYSTCLAAILLAASYAGRGPGYLATAVAALGVAVVFLARVPSSSPMIQRQFGLVVFASVGVLITEFVAARRRAELALEESEDRFRSMADNVSDIVWIVEIAPDRIVYVSPSYERLWGRPARDLYADPRQWIAAIHADDRSRIDSVFSAWLAGERELFDEEYRVVRPDGTTAWIHARGTLIRDAAGKAYRASGIASDITERKRMEERIRAGEELWRATFENNPTMYFMVDAAGIVLSINAFAAEQLGYSVEELRGRSIVEVVLEDDRETVKGGLSRCLERLGEALRWELRKVRKDGTVIRVREWARAVNGPAGTPIVLVACEDVSEAKRAEEALAAAKEELAHVSRLTTLGELTASIAHEVNQPLAAIGNNAGACARWLAAQNLDEAKRCAEQIKADSARAGEIVRRIRDLAKKAPPQKQPLDVAELCREVVAFARAELQRNRVTLHTQLSSGVLPIAGDRVQLQQVILNLLVNAVEAVTGADGPREVWVTTEADADHVVIAVRDTGPGVDPGQIDRLFKPFYTTKPHGLGMGLTISRSIVEAHGGQLSATPSAPRGAVFRVTLPAGAAEKVA